MVIRDLSDIDHPLKASSEKSAPPIAFVIDRFIALIFDFLIFSPLVSLSSATLMKEVKTLLLLNPSSSEAFLVWGVLAVMMFIMTVLLQSVFLYFWQATPGQMFLQLRVISYPESQARLRYSQCLLRSFFWTSSFFVVLPFLEILSHPLRRAFYDRASDTLVITLKKEHDEGPLPLEARYISSWTRLFFLVLALVGTTAFFKSYHNVRALVAETEVSASMACSDDRLKSFKGDQRLDMAMSLYLLSAINSDCLESEAESALWEDPHGNPSLAYLAKALTVPDTQEQEIYKNKICKDDEESEVCRLSRLLLSEENKMTSFKTARGSLISAKVMEMETLLENSDFIGALGKLKALRQNSSLSTALEKKYVRMIWSLQETKKSGRAPASAGEQDFIQEFKDLYEVP